jgi:hypothetical protein
LLYLLSDLNRQNEDEDEMKIGFETELAAFEDEIEDRMGENVEMGD